MSKGYPNSPKSYVDIAPATPILPSNTSRTPSFWPTPHAEARIDGLSEDPSWNVQLQGSSSEYLVPHLQNLTDSRLPQAEQIVRNQYSTNTNPRYPPVEFSKQLSSTRFLTSLTAETQSATSRGLYTPPNSVVRSQTKPDFLIPIAMDDSKRMSGSYRQVMGPPETPSRIMQASPNMFPNLQFSPDLFSSQSVGPMTAPAYPQQQLFWDPVGPTPQSTVSDQYYNPYQDAFSAAFDESAASLTGFTPLTTQDQTYDLPLAQSQPSPALLDTSNFPGPFHTSPRALPTVNENPAQFLSSPARRFGGSEMTGTMPFKRPVRDMPAYHHQMQESRREMELEREKRRNKVSKKADDELIMKSVRRALSPNKTLRPGLQRSVTHSGISAYKFQQRHQSRVSFNDAASASSIGSNNSGRNGRSSPLKRISSVAGITRTGSFAKSRTAVTLAIDENGVAKTVVEDVADSDDDMDDPSSSSVASSADDADMHMLRSQPNSFAYLDSGDFPKSSQATIGTSNVTNTYEMLGQESAKRMKRLSLGSFSHVDHDRQRAFDDTIRPIRQINHVDMAGGKGDAQRALKAIIQDRSRSTSTQGDYPSSRQSDSSVQFHSSPPIQQSHFSALNASPTTITDPDLATPSTDQDSFAAATMRCVCSSNSPGGSSVVQCESCSKWLHTNCVGINQQIIPNSFICIYCEQTPLKHPSNRTKPRSSQRASGASTSPLAHKSARSKRTR